MSESFLIVGAGGHAKVVIDALTASGATVRGCVDDNPMLMGREPVRGGPVIGTVADLRNLLRADDKTIVAIGDNAVRCRLARRLGVAFGLAVAPSAVLSRTVATGEGSMILPSVTVNVHAEIATHVILNTSCSVDHDCRIGDFVHIGPGVCMGGGVAIGEGSFLGVGVCVVPGVRIGRWSIVGAGAVVTRDLPDNCTAVGVPARIIKTRPEGWHLA